MSNYDRDLTPVGNARRIERDQEIEALKAERAAAIQSAREWEATFRASELLAQRTQAMMREDLKRLDKDLAAATSRAELAERERDLLREALRALVEHCDLGHTHALGERRQNYLEALDAAREALEKANG